MATTLFSNGLSNSKGFTAFKEEACKKEVGFKENSFLVPFRIFNKNGIRIFLESPENIQFEFNNEFVFLSKAKKFVLLISTIQIFTYSIS